MEDSVVAAPSLRFEELVQIARERKEILGVYLFGSRGRSFMVDERSDWDVAVVMADEEARRAFDREFPHAHGAIVELVSTTLDELRDEQSEHARYASAHAEVVVDKTGGELTRVVADQERLPDARKHVVAREALDAYINQTYRSLRYGTRLDAVEAIPHALRLIFALDGRVRPYNKYLAWELEHHPLGGWSGDALLPLLDGVLTGEPRPQHTLFRSIEERARRAGLGDVIEGWEPDLDWLRGTSGYREAP
jgi:predicted nucleotidyltransferase